MCHNLVFSFGDLVFSLIGIFVCQFKLTKRQFKQLKFSSLSVLILQSGLLQTVGTQRVDKQTPGAAAAEKHSCNWETCDHDGMKWAFLCMGSNPTHLLFKTQISYKLWKNLGFSWNTLLLVKVLSPIAILWCDITLFSISRASSCYWVSRHRFQSSFALYLCEGGLLVVTLPGHEEERCQHFCCSNWLSYTV